MPSGLRGANAPVLLGSFVAAGIWTTLLGPLLPWLGERWGIGPRALGALFAAQFVASMLGVAACGWLLPRRRYRAALVAGSLAMALGLALLAASAGFPSGLAAVAVYGLGLGLVIPAGNLLAAHAAAPDSAAALNLLNFAWGAGAVASPALVAAVLAAFAPKVALAAAALLPLACAAAWLAWRPAVAPAPRRRVPPPPPGALRNLTWRRLALLMFLYVGCENGIGGWLATLAHNQGFAGRQWLVPVALFWAGLLAGRAAAPWPLGRVRALAWARLTLPLALAGIAALLLPAAPEWACDAAAAAAGLGLAAIFPILLSMLSPPRAGATAPAALDPLLFVPAALGGAALPWLIGAAAPQVGLRLAMALPLAAAIAIFALLPRPAAMARAAAG